MAYLRAELRASEAVVEAVADALELTGEYDSLGMKMRAIVAEIGRLKAIDPECARVDDVR